MFSTVTCLDYFTSNNKEILTESHSFISFSALPPHMMGKVWIMFLLTMALPDHIVSITSVDKARTPELHHKGT
jgi:hypothetical protein